MMRIFIFGVTGAIGFRLGRLLVGQGISVAGLYRQAGDRTRLEDAGIEAHEGDLRTLSRDEIAAKLRNADVVVYTAGVKSDDADLSDFIDFEAVAKTADATEYAGVKRYVLVSAFPESGRQRPRDEGYEHYIRNKKLADAHLVSTGLEWLVVRPGRFTDAPACGKVALAAALPYGDISRDDFANVLKELIIRSVSRRVIEVTNGGVDVNSAVQRLLS